MLTNWSANVTNLDINPLFKSQVTNQLFPDIGITKVVGYKQNDFKVANQLFLFEAPIFVLFKYMFF